jgi:uncharacterized RDD family membrane protein YckC
MKDKFAAEIVLANWSRRFIAWFVDYLLIVLMYGYFQLEALMNMVLPAALGLTLWSPLMILMFYLYFTFSEWYFGRTIGQLLLNVRLVDIGGRGASLKASAIQSIGKSTPLLLFFDCLLGVTYRPTKDR